MGEQSYRVIVLGQDDSWDSKAIQKRIESEEGNAWEFMSLSFREDDAVLVFRKPKEYA